MAEPPRWGYDLGDDARWVLAHGLPTTLSAPDRPLEASRWVSLVGKAGGHGLSGLLVGAVADGSVPTTAAQRTFAGELELDLTRRRMNYEHFAAAPLALLADAGVEVRVLKGLAFAHLEYPDEQWRPTGDLDLLVHGTQIEAAIHALADAGGHVIDPEPVPGFYRHVGKGATVRLPDGAMEVDLHRLLVWGPFGVRVPAEELWTVTRTFSAGDLALTTVGREESLLHACAHLLVLGMVRAREARDVAQILCHPELDPARALHLARRWGQEALLASAALLAERELRLTDDAHPLQAWARGYPVTLRDRLWLRTEAPVDRIHGLEQAAVWTELGPGPARRILWRANLRPAPGTYASPATRTRNLLATLRRSARP